jgi:tetraacyldisaccharide 4'-kinase
VSVGPDRVAAALAIQSFLDCDVIISDDGLQHYALGRDVEIVVIDGERGFGNEFCLPAGPLRESVGRLDSVDMVVSNGTTGPGRYIMQLGNDQVVNLLDSTQTKKLDDFKKGGVVYAMAGIGHPERFFKHLENSGISIERLDFPDHYKYTEADLEIAGDATLLMTEKDAVKCKRFAKPNHWYVRVDAQLHDTFAIRITKLMKDLIYG